MVGNVRVTAYQHVDDLTSIIKADDDVELKSVTLDFSIDSKRGLDALCLSISPNSAMVPNNTATRAISKRAQ